MYGGLLYVWGFTVCMGVYCMYGGLLYVWRFTDSYLKCQGNYVQCQLL